MFTAESEAKVVRVEQQRMRTALLDAEMELQQAAVAAHSTRRSLQASLPVDKPRM